MFEWKDDYSVGVEKFDEQHKELLKIGRELVSVLDGLEDGIDQYDYMLELLQELQDYTVYHFDSEEEAMEKYDYPGLEEHRKKHNNFVEKLKEVDVDEIDENQKKFNMELMNFIASWIEQHILGEDQKYKAHLKNTNL